MALSGLMVLRSAAEHWYGSPNACMVLSYQFPISFPTQMWYAQIAFNVPTDVASGYVNNSKTNYKFRFNGVLKMEVTQVRITSRSECELDAA